MSKKKIRSRGSLKLSIQIFKRKYDVFEVRKFYSTYLYTHTRAHKKIHIIQYIAHFFETPN